MRVTLLSVCVKLSVSNVTPNYNMIIAKYKYLAMPGSSANSCDIDTHIIIVHVHGLSQSGSITVALQEHTGLDSLLLFCCLVLSRPPLSSPTPPHLSLVCLTPRAHFLVLWFLPTVGDLEQDNQNNCSTRSQCSHSPEA